MKEIVVSGINIREGGPLTVLREMLSELSLFNQKNGSQHNILAIVSDKTLFSDISGIDFFVFDQYKPSWINRVLYEYWVFRGFSKKRDIYLWISMHDMTPWVVTNRQVVFCHNAAIFYSGLNYKTLQHEPKVAMFSLFYKYLYRLNIKKNDHVIVQQQWIANEFKKIFPVKSVLVCNSSNNDDPVSNFVPNESDTNACHTFIYPAFPRIFKNHEVLLEAARLLEGRMSKGFQVLITLAGNENSYSNSLYERYKDCNSIKFIGLKKHDELLEILSISDCLVFPSQLETWGLPITEAKMFGKKILLVDLPYAHETVGDYDLVEFFDPNNASILADKMQKVIDDDLVFKGNVNSNSDAILGWNALFHIVVGNQ